MVPRNLNDGSSAGAPKTLYRKVKQDLLDRLLRGEWRPGELIPSEVALAGEYGVSVGTARKAVDELASERLVQRSRGRGTTVASNRGRYEPFRFYRLLLNDESLARETTRYVSIETARASAREAKGLGIRRGSAVTRILRLRCHHDKVMVVERIVLAEQRCSGAAAVIRRVKPPSLYSVLERNFDILVCKVEEKVWPKTAGEDAELLGVEVGTPVLEVERRAFDLSGTVVEYRVMRAADGVHYAGQAK